MPDEPGITADITDRIGAIIERDGLLDPGNPNQASVRSAQNTPKAPIVEEENADADALADLANLSDEELAALQALGDDEGTPDDQNLEPELDDEGNPIEVKPDEGATISSLAGLAEEFDVPETEFLEQIMVDNGSGQEIPLSEVVSGYRRANLQMAAFRQDLEGKFQERLTETNSAADVELVKIGELAKLLQTESKREFDVDWEMLKTTDPIRYVDLKEKQARLNQVMAGVVQTFERNSGEREKQAQADRRRVEIREADLLAQKRPELVNNEKAAMAFAQENVEALKQVGFEDPGARINDIYDHREILILNAAAKYFASVDAAKRKNLKNLREQKGLRRPGMVNRRTARVDQGDPTKVARKLHTARAKKSGSVNDAAKAIESFLKPI